MLRYTVVSPQSSKMIHTNTSLLYQYLNHFMYVTWTPNKEFTSAFVAYDLKAYARVLTLAVCRNASHANYFTCAQNCTQGMQHNIMTPRLKRKEFIRVFPGSIGWILKRKNLQLFSWHEWPGFAEDTPGLTSRQL
jgi:hypothetical protein